MTEWNDENTAQLRSLWAEGRTGAQIGNALGFSRCAILGKAHRIRLPGRKPDHIIRKKISNKRPKRDGVGTVFKTERRVIVKQVGSGFRTQISIKKFVARAPVLVATPEPVSRNVGILDLKRGQCKWAHGDGPWLFCGSPTDGRPYCEHHHMRCYVPESAMKRSRGLKKMVVLFERVG